MEVLGSREVGDHSVEKRPEFCACVCEDDNENETYAVDSSDEDELLEHGHESKSIQKGLGKCVSLPSFASVMPPEDDEVGTVLRRILSASSLESTPYSFSVPSPTPSKLVSALKGSREKRGKTWKKRSVTWASDVYDPPPTSLLHMIRNKKQLKVKRSNNDKRKITRKVMKASKSSHLSSGDKDVKQVRRNNNSSSSGSSYRWYKQLVAELCEIECCFCRFDEESSSNVRMSIVG
ncbi:uncharacterized protein LOC120183917 [Hibiscus syriacus]|uniref:uncharacterized protein LOC120183917 n=1 Tax=Hibiscus syriacus TaxID=106335 RepID=UPI001922EDE8|nr:uncharacterized protein LOC120183917 [Hibiscus syriacus]